MTNEEVQYVVVTRYETPEQSVIRHAYGPYTKNKARREAEQMVRDISGKTEGIVEIHVLKLLDI